MTDFDATYLTIREVAAALRDGRVSPVGLAQSALERIDTLDGSIHSYVTVTRELALSQAKEAERELSLGHDRGPLHGIPIGVKDLFATRGVRTTAHSKVLVDWVPDEDATAVARLRDAGCVLLGKHALHEFAYSGPSLDTPFPPARNPWNLTHETGGSSSGSAAALAAGFCFGALGSDTGASIRKPAAMCGVVGLKPTYGRVSRHGAVPLAWSLDHVGPMARSVEDCALLLQAIAGYDRQDARSADRSVPDYAADLGAGVEGLRLGLPEAWLHDRNGIDPDMAVALEAALKVLEGLGARIVEVDAAPFVDARDVTLVIVLAEAYAYHEHDLQSRPADFGRGFRLGVMEGAFLTAADYIQALRARTAVAGRIEEVLREVDAIVSPSMPGPAQPMSGADPETRYGMPNFTGPFNLAGLPAISVPCGFSSDGLPLGVQIAGRAFDETTVLRIASAYEQATDWHDRRPPI